MPASRPVWLRRVDVGRASASNNNEVADQAHYADVDVISAGRQPSDRPLRLGRLIWLLVIVETAALAGSVAVALHYRTEASALRHGTPSASSRPTSPQLPQMTSITLQLPADGTITGTVIITVAAEPHETQARFTVSAVITGARPGTVYDLTGNDCSAAAPPPDRVWATGLASADGMAELAGHAWTGAAADEYWLALAPSPVSPPPGLHGRFAAGTATLFPAGQAPCAGPT
jgi:hypothetical protein